jgi:hypothetical protein
MPYRRLPNTDQARLRALETAISRCEGQSFGNEVVSFATIFEAKNCCSVFGSQLGQYQKVLENQINANKQYQQIVANARMYISHFIQVFNLAVIRGDIKAEHKRLYRLEPDTHIVPDLSTDSAILEWGKHIIDGESERIRNGGTPIYNPAISKVKVHYEIFKEYNGKHKLHHDITNRNRGGLVELRKKCDDLILSIWNQVEEKFKNEEPSERLRKCQEYGVVYYYRKGEEKFID